MAKEEASSPFKELGNKRPLCKYGANCYRKNPAHFMEYAHPGQSNILFHYIIIIIVVHLA